GPVGELGLTRLHADPGRLRLRAQPLAGHHLAGRAEILGHPHVLADHLLDLSLTAPRQGLLVAVDEKDVLHGFPFRGGGFSRRLTLYDDGRGSISTLAHIFRSRAERIAGTVA